METSPLKKSEIHLDSQEALSDEMADILWVLLCLANQTDISLTAALEKNFKKKTIRDADRHQLNEKLHNKDDQSG